MHASSPGTRTSSSTVVSTSGLRAPPLQRHARSQENTTISITDRALGHQLAESRETPTSCSKTPAKQLLLVPSVVAQTTYTTEPALPIMPVPSPAAPIRSSKTPATNLKPVPSNPVLRATSSEPMLAPTHRLASLARTTTLSTAAPAMAGWLPVQFQRPPIQFKAAVAKVPTPAKSLLSVTPSAWRRVLAALRATQTTLEAVRVLGTRRVMSRTMSEMAVAMATMPVQKLPTGQRLVMVCATRSVRVTACNTSVIDTHPHL
mmetsp:Transcript_11213/g.31026  ORF Transcript_11213/g.31026 Transcript_11213/m.31026 type:complete len:261 (+) Transcript_11213:70-852(+)